MNPQELADLYLGEYKDKGNEVNAKNCPFCGPNPKRDNQYKFFMNKETGAYKCYRENHCGAEGGFKDLLEHFGEEDYDNYYKPKKKKYKKPKVSNTTEVKGKVAEYLKKRGISEKTWDNKYLEAKNGRIVFKYFKNDELVLVKYRSADKKKKYSAEPGGKPVLWGIDEVDPDDSVIITEGEFDKLAIEECGIDNVVSVPMGSNNLKWIEHDWSVLEKVKEFIIWPDNDEAGIKMKNEVVNRLGKHRCKVVKSEMKDANLLMFKKGKQAIYNALDNAEFEPIDNVIRMAEVEPLKLNEIDSCPSSVPALNRVLGGFMMGYITVWTGKNSSGKSTLLNQEILEAIDKGYGVGLYSGELNADLVQKWIAYQAAGPQNLEYEYHELKREEMPEVPDDVMEKIRKWYGDNFFYYDLNSSTKPKKILNTFENLYKQYGTKIFVIDNIMTPEYGGGSHEYLHRQSRFITAIKQFAQRLNVHVHIVAHPRKSKGKVEKEDVAGLYEITNKTDNLVAFHRVTKNNIDSFGDEIKNKYIELNQLADKPKDFNVVEIQKSRIYGWQNVKSALKFDIDSKRFYPFNSRTLKNKKYGWEK